MEKLLVGSRNCTPVVDGVIKQVAIVRDHVQDTVPIHGVLCFVEADWPLIGGSFTTRGVEALWPKKLYPNSGQTVPWMSRPSPGSTACSHSTSSSVTDRGVARSLNHPLGRGWDTSSAPVSGRLTFVDGFVSQPTSLVATNIVAPGEWPMVGEIELVDDGDGLAVIGSSTAVEEFLQVHGLWGQSKNLDLREAEVRRGRGRRRDGGGCGDLRELGALAQADS